MAENGNAQRIKWIAERYDVVDGHQRDQQPRQRRSHEKKQQVSRARFFAPKGEQLIETQKSKSNDPERHELRLHSRRDNEPAKRCNDLAWIQRTPLNKCSGHRRYSHDKKTIGE